MTVQPLVRAAQFAGSWYPTTLEEAESYWTRSELPLSAKAVVCPHAGWMYSGRVAGEVYGKIQPCDTYVVIGPNHTGSGKSSVSVFGKGRWQLPETHMDIDEALVRDLMHLTEFAAEDPEAHAREHAIEVQLPFLLLLNPKAKLVPIVMREPDPEMIHDLGRSLAGAIRKATDRRVMLVASTDMTHYEARTSAAQKDRAAIDRILAIDADGLVGIVNNLGITMCGLGPTAAVLVAAQLLGASHAELVRYATSGDITQDDDSVVGYAGIVIT